MLWDVSMCEFYTLKPQNVAERNQISKCIERYASTDRLKDLPCFIGIVFFFPYSLCCSPTPKKLRCNNFKGVLFDSIFSP